jgi:Na+/proline symporter
MFAGFAFAAIAIGALVPAAIMSIGAANLFTRNFRKAYINPLVTVAGEAKVAKITSLTVKAGALLVVLFCQPNSRSICNCSEGYGFCKRFRPWFLAFTPVGSGRTARSPDGRRVSRAVHGSPG